MNNAPLPQSDDTLQSDISGHSLSRRSRKIYIKPIRSDFPSSQCENWASPIPPIPEGDAIKSLKLEHKRRPERQPDYECYSSQLPILIISLQDFTIYRSPYSGRDTHKSEMAPLQSTDSKVLCVDGYLCLGGVKYYIECVNVKDMSVDGYGNNKSPEVTIYLRSEAASNDTHFDIWYRLGKPSPVYQRFHDAFLWIAQLGKHVIDFMDAQKNQQVGLHDFRQRFHSWLSVRFHGNSAFRRWHHAFCGQIDFRGSINANSEYIYQQSYNLPDSKLRLAHTVWGDCMVAGMRRIASQPEEVQHTITTPFVFENFKHMYFGEKLCPMKPATTVALQSKNRMSQLGFASCSPDPSAPINSLSKDVRYDPYERTHIKAGDYVTFDADTNDRKVWKSSASFWLAYVQRAEGVEEGVQRLFVFYLYRPEDTTIFDAKYLHPTELFFSDYCNCKDRHLLSTEIKGKCSVEVLPHTITSKKFFIRQTYLTQDNAFVTFKEEHRKCSCALKGLYLMGNHQPGDTVYVTRNFRGSKILEPAVIIKVHYDTRKIGLRVLSRLRRDFSMLANKAGRIDIAKNELVLTDQVIRVPVRHVERHCGIRYMSKEDVLGGKIPFPYDQGGAGDFWFLSMGLVTTSSDTYRLVFLKKLPNDFKEGRAYKPLEGQQKLSGLSIFSGGGNLDRGLEESGAVEFKTAVDYSPHAIHTQRANARNPSELQLYCGSVDDYLLAVLKGREDARLIAKIGAVSLIAAGSPCPGFSTLQKDFLSDQSLRNASHVTTLASYADIYRPEYGVFENVPNMASKRKGLGKENVLSQLIASLVGMGYQVSQFTMDSWNYGSGQRRTRLFLCIAAPGLEPVTQPAHTHSRPLEDTTAHSLGELPNGQRFGQREHYTTPFKFATAGDITAGLPDIGNGSEMACIPFPDHRVPSLPGHKGRALLQFIPRYPSGSGYKQAFQRGLVPHALQKPGKEVGKSCQRIDRDGLIPTITTKSSFQDSFNGAVVHWEESRALTVQDARRTQGYPDHEVIIGRPADQYKIVGNGVDRKKGFAIGRKLREAVEKNWEVKMRAARRDLERELLVNRPEDWKLKDLVGVAEFEMLVDEEDTLGGRDNSRLSHGPNGQHIPMSSSRFASKTQIVYQQQSENVTIRLKRTSEGITVHSEASEQPLVKRRKF